MKAVCIVMLLFTRIISKMCKPNIEGQKPLTERFCWPLSSWKWEFKNKTTFLTRIYTIWLIISFTFSVCRFLFCNDQKCKTKKPAWQIHQLVMRSGSSSFSAIYLFYFRQNDHGAFSNKIKQNRTCLGKEIHLKLF